MFGQKTDRRGAACCAQIGKWLPIGLLSTLSVFLFACSQPAPSATVSTTSTVNGETAVVSTRPEIQQLPVTFTPPPTDFAPTATLAPTLPTLTPSPTPPFFDETVVELSYAIPAIQLNRRLQGDIGGEIIVVDETTGLALRRTNQGAVMIELQQVLIDLTLEPVPEGCDTCVEVSYNLPLANREQRGWLQDPVLLASVENYMAVSLGPHFPPGTMLGLRRSASTIFPAHSLALTKDGRLFRWLATTQQVDLPLAAANSAPALSTQLAELTSAQFRSDYLADCAAKPVETLRLPSAESSRDLRIICPEFALPATLQPLYLSLDTLLAPLLASTGGVEPEFAFPLAALLDYRAANGEQLTLYPNNQAVAVRPPNSIITGTLTSTNVISLTNELIASGELLPDLSGYSLASSANVSDTLPLNRLILRGPNDVYTTSWQETAVSILNDLDLLLDSLLPPEPTPTATQNPTASPEATISPTATPSP